jgi:hypothetical protein
MIAVGSSSSYNQVKGLSHSINAIDPAPHRINHWAAPRTSNGSMMVSQIIILMAAAMRYHAV